MAGGYGEVAEAQRRLEAAEKELGDAKAKLGAAEAAQPLDEQRVAKAELGVAEAKLGVAKAELGVAEAKWEAADGDDKVVFRENLDAARASVKSAQAVVETASIAYENALRAAAPPHGARRVLPPPLSNLSPPGSNEDKVKQFVQVAVLAPLLVRNRKGDVLKQYKELSEILGLNTVNVWGETCAISHLQPTAGTSLSRAHIIPQAALKKNDDRFHVTEDLRQKINGGIFSTFNALPMHSTIEGWFDQGLFCVHECGKIAFWDDALQEAERTSMSAMLSEYVSERITKCEPLMAAFAWHRQFVFQMPGGVRAMFDGSTGSSAKGGSVSEGGSERGSGRSGGGGSAASQGTTGEEPQQQTRQGAHGTEGSALLDSVSKARGLSSQDKVLAWDAAEADTVFGDFEPHWIV